MSRLRSSLLRVLPVAVLTTALTGFGSSRPAPGSLDVTFGGDGLVTTSFGGEADEDLAYALAVQSDGRLVVAGSARPAAERGPDFALARYRPDGRLDRTFGLGGTVTTDFAAGSDFAYTVAVQRDGKVVAAGAAVTGPEIADVDFGLVRYERDGSLDRSFGDAGRVTTDFNGGLDRVHAVVVQPDGKLVAAGWATTTPDRGNDDFGLVRYERDGSLDRSFGDGGRVTTDLGGSSENVNALILQGDGRLVAAGSAGADFGLVRYRRDGTLDASFGVGGRVTTDFHGFNDTAHALVLLPDGRLVAAGRTDTFPAGDFALARYDRRGRLDPTFGQGGTTFAGVSDDTIEYAQALVAEPDGRLVAAGFFGLFRFEADGAVDATFGDAGFVPTDYAPHAVARQRDGRLVAAGIATTIRDDGSTEIDLAVARYHSGARHPA